MVGFERESSRLPLDYHNVCYRDRSLEEQQVYEELCIKMEMSLMMLGRVYGALILGLGLCDLHHMACGRLTCLC